MNRLQQTGLALLLGLLPSAAHADAIESQSNVGSLQDATVKIFRVLLIMLPIVATLYLILSGYRYIVAQGNTDLVEKAKKSLLYAIFGVVIAYAATAIILIAAKTLHFDPGFV